MWSQHLGTLNEAIRHKVNSTVRMQNADITWLRECYRSIRYLTNQYHNAGAVRLILSN